MFVCMWMLLVSLSMKATSIAENRLLKKFSDDGYIMDSSVFITHWVLSMTMDEWAEIPTAIIHLKIGNERKRKGDGENVYVWINFNRWLEHLPKWRDVDSVKSGRLSAKLTKVFFEYIHPNGKRDSPTFMVHINRSFIRSLHTRRAPFGSAPTVRWASPIYLRIFTKRKPSHRKNCHTVEFR